jgi:UDP-galactopyranose mutase
MYDYLVVGSGLYGAVFAYEAKRSGKSVLVIDKRPNIAGNVYTEEIEGINVHKYGAHIFHTNNKEVWDYVRKFAEFNRFTNSPVANYKGELYSLPFNMYTFNKIWGVVTPEEASKSNVRKSQANQRIWRSRQSVSSDVTSTRSSSRATLKSNGVVTAKSFHPS